MMLRQYYASRTACNGLSPDVHWALKERRDASPTPHLHPMSTRILGVGVLLVGVLVLSVALIMGIEFPKYVHVHLREDQCVLHDQHEKYNTWREGTQWTREAHVYYWELTNSEDFLYRGAVPEMRERGPYVYTEYEIRDDVSFNVVEATFRVQRRHHFNAEQTTTACPSCQENDTLTILNVDYLREVYRRGGDTDYLLSRLSSFLQTILLSRALFVADTFSSNISTLGCLDSVCDTNYGDLSEPLANVSFGQWLRNVNTSYSSVILDNRTRTSFSVSETGGIYKVLVNASVLGGDLTSGGLGGVLLNTQCRKWARNVCRGLTLSSSSPANSSTCGIIHLLRECEATSVNVGVVRDMLTSTFCPQNGGPWCLDLKSSSHQVLAAYFEAFKDFVLVHLLQIVHEYLLVQGNRDLVVTRSQRDLALGYSVTDDVDGEEAWRHVQGVLGETWLKSEDNEGVLWRVETCLQDRDMNNNMKVREFNGSQFAPTSLLKDPSRTKLPLQGQTDFVTACDPLVTCQACAEPSQNLFLFLPSLWRRVRYGLGGSTTLLGTKVYRYWLSSDTFSWDDTYEVTCGLQTMTPALGFVGWVGLPRLTLGLASQAVGGETNCTLDPPDSFVDVEAATGRVWQKKSKLQTNVGLRSEDVSAARLRPINISYINKPIPLVWTERRVLLSDDELGFYNHKVDRLMNVSCGGLIGLSIVSVVIMMFGVVIFFYPKRVNRVAPTLEESSATNLNARHGPNNT